MRSVPKTDSSSHRRRFAKKRRETRPHIENLGSFVNFSSGHALIWSVFSKRSASGRYLIQKKSISDFYPCLPMLTAGRRERGQGIPTFLSSHYFSSVSLFRFPSHCRQSSSSSSSSSSLAGPPGKRLGAGGGCLFFATEGKKRGLFLLFSSSSYCRCCRKRSNDSS